MVISFVSCKNFKQLLKQSTYSFFQLLWNSPSHFKKTISHIYKTKFIILFKIINSWDNLNAKFTQIICVQELLFVCKNLVMCRAKQNGFGQLTMHAKSKWFVPNVTDLKLGLHHITFVSIIWGSTKWSLQEMQQFATYTQS